MDKIVQGITLTPLRIIENPLGNIYHSMKKSDAGYEGFGESYFSFIKPGAIKGWKKHLKMTLNLIVPVGSVKFVIYDDRNPGSSSPAFFEIILSPDNYQRLTIQPGLWMAFQGIGPTLNLIQNIANIEHNPDEALRCDIDQIAYSWK